MLWVVGLMDASDRRKLYDCLSGVTARYYHEQAQEQGGFQGSQVCLKDTL